MKHRRMFIGIAFSLLSTQVATAAEVMRICISDIAASPLTNPDGSGEAQKILSKATQKTGQHLSITILPWRRCRAEVANGKQDGAVMAYSPETADQAVFPMHDSLPDHDLRLGTLRRIVVRALNVSADWDGTAFYALHQPVLLGQGQAYTKARILALGARANDSPKDPKQALNMLLAGRAELAVISEYDARQLLTQSPFAGRIEALPKPFVLALRENCPIMPIEI